MVEAIRRTGQTVAKNVLNELKVLEEVEEEVVTTMLKLKLTCPGTRPFYWKWW